MQGITFAKVKLFQTPDGRRVHYAGSGGRWVPAGGTVITTAVVRLFARRGPSCSLEELRAAYGHELETL